MYSEMEFPIVGSSSINISISEFEHPYNILSVQMKKIESKVFLWLSFSDNLSFQSQSITCVTSKMDRFVINWFLCW